MKITLKQSDVVAFVKANPGCTSMALAKHFSIEENRAAGAMANAYATQAVRREKVKVAGRQRASYVYWVNDEPPAPMIAKPAVPIRRIEAPAPADAPREPLIPVLDLLLDSLANTVVEGLAMRIQTQLAGRLQTMVMPASPAIEAPANDAPEADKNTANDATRDPVQQSLLPETENRPALRRVGIVGLFPNHIQEVDKEFGEALRITYWHQHGNAGWDRLQAIAEFCDIVFVMRKNVSHRTTNHLESHGANTILLEGSLSSLQVALFEYLTGKVAA